MSVKVVHTFGRNAGVVQTIDKPVVRFGRAPDSDVVFDPDFDRDASANHAEARFEGGSWVIVDLGSRNGTFVGGERVERRAITSGDEITFGSKGPRVRLEIGSQAELFSLFINCIPFAVPEGSTDPLQTYQSAPKSTKSLSMLEAERLPA